MCKYLLTMSILLATTNLFASYSKLADQDQFIAVKNGGAAFAVLNDIKCKIEAMEQAKEHYISTVIAPDNLWRTTFNNLAIEDSIIVDSVTYRLPQGVTKSQFSGEYMPNAYMIVSNTTKGLKRESVEIHQDYFLIKYSYEASPFDKKGGRYEIVVEAPKTAEFKLMERKQTLALENLSRRQVTVMNNPELNINLDKSQFSQLQHKHIINCLETYEQQFNQSCVLLWQLFNKKDVSLRSEKIYAALATSIFQLRDVVEDGSKKLSGLIVSGKDEKKINEAYDEFKRNVDKHFDINILKFFTWGIETIAGRSPSETTYVTFFEDALNS